MERRIELRLALASSAISSSAIIHLFNSLLTGERGSMLEKNSARESSYSSLSSLSEIFARGLIRSATFNTELISRISLAERVLPISSLLRLPLMSLVPENDTAPFFHNLDKASLVCF